MRTEINKKQGRPSEHSEVRTAGGVGGGWVVGAVSPPSPPPKRGPGAEKLAFLRFIIVKNAISLQEMQDIPDR